VLRVGAVTSIGLALLAVALVATEGPAGGDDPAETAASRVYPALRAVSELGPDGLPEQQARVFPGPAAVQAARAFARTRRGKVSFAVGDGRGNIAGQAFDETYASASLVKAMILVAYLDRAGDEVSDNELASLDAMIRVSDNHSATQLFRRIGPEAVRDVARRADLKSFSIDGDWGAARVTAADQVRFFLAIDRLLPAARRRSYARYLLSHVAPSHAWGIPQAARPRGWQAFFKGGWRPDSSGQLVHQAALLERGSRRIAIAVLTDASPSEKYGRATVKGIAERLLGDAARPGELVPIKSLG
jgi:beta-lactamase class A